jgi:hypothetical protein
VTATPVLGGCAGATVLPAAGGTVSGVTAGAGTLAGSCGTSGPSAERVFAWTPTVSGTATAVTCGEGTTYDSVVYVRSGSCTGPELACNDDTPGCVTGEPHEYHGSHVVWSVTAGTTYFIVVDGFNGRSGAFSLVVTPPGGS